jgi:hypothetical protein
MPDSFHPRIGAWKSVKPKKLKVHSAGSVPVNQIPVAPNRTCHQCQADIPAVVLSGLRMTRGGTNDVLPGWAGLCGSCASDLVYGVFEAFGDRPEQLRAIALKLLDIADKQS